MFFPAPVFCGQFFVLPLSNLHNFAQKVQNTGFTPSNVGILTPKANLAG